MPVTTPEQARDLAEKLNVEIARQRSEDRYDYLRSCAADAVLPASLGTPDEWAWTAISILKVQYSDQLAGRSACRVRFAAVSALLSYVERLETRMGVIAPANDRVS